jgi:two-component system chemotaxis response regulator CheY
MSFSFEGLRFLLVDDNHHMRAIAAAILRSADARQIREANDGAEALDALRTWPADIAIADFKMAPMDGVEFARQVRHGRDPYLPIIMMTGFSDRSRVFEARDAGVNEVLVKPITARGLLERVERVVLNPRPFIRTDSYFGPCRRRRDDGDYRGEERRGADLNSRRLEL